MTKITKEDLANQRMLCESLAYALYEDSSAERRRAEICLQIEKLVKERDALDVARERLPDQLKTAERKMAIMAHDYKIQSDPLVQELQRLKERVDALMKDIER